MRFPSLDLPPLTLIMLLVFLWLMLLVLLLWSWLRTRRPIEPPAPRREPDRQRERLERDTPIQLPRPTIVREVKPETRAAVKHDERPDDEQPADDPFDSYQPNSRRDDFDF